MLIEILKWIHKKSIRSYGIKILSNPISFLGVTFFFLATLYLLWIENEVSAFSVKDFLSLVIIYIFTLGIFMDKGAPNSQDIDNKAGERVEIKQNNISLISFFKNTKK